MPIWSAEIKDLEKLYESFKGQLPDLEKELERLLKTNDENIILVYARRCLEVIITDLCECELKRPRKTEPLKGIIDKLKKEEKVPSNIITSMDHLNSLSAYGAHPKDFEPEQVKPVLVNLDIIIKWYLKYKSIIVISKEEEKIPVDKEKSEEVNKQAGIEQMEKPVKLTKNRLLSVVLITSVLGIAGILLYQKVFKRDTLESLREKGKFSVAIIPFQNMTNDTIWNVWQDGIQNELISSLTNSEELKVRQSETINTLIQSKGLTNYASITPSVASKISQKLNADIFIYGSIKQVGNTLRINAQLTDSKTQDVFKSFQIDGIAENILHITDSLSTMVKNFLTISKLEKEIPISYRYRITTNSPEALKYYIYGQNAFYKTDFLTASKLYSQALTVDSSFTGAAIGLSLSYANQSLDNEGFIINQGLFDEARNLLVKLYEKKDQMPLEMKIRTCRFYAVFFETPNEVIQYQKQLLELDDQSPGDHGNLGGAYFQLYQYDKGIPEFEKALEICKKWGLKPPWIYAYTTLGNAYHKTGQFKKEKKIYRKAEKDFPDELELLQQQAILALSEGNTKDANEYIEKYKSIYKGQSFPEANIISNIGDIYFEAEIWNKAEEYYRNALLLQPENPERMNHLAYFLINKDRNIKEGLKLVDKALELSPDNWSFLDTKGWGLYKLAKYKEALELLEKSWVLKPIYFHEIFLHLEAAKKAVASLKSN